MKKIVVASKNPVKLNAALLGFSSLFPNEQFEIIGTSVPSGVSDQPMGDEETLAGAMNRVEAAYGLGGGDYYVGIEGGVAEVQGEMHVFAWVVVKSDAGRVGKGRTGVFLLPHKVASLIREGYELGVADDMVFGERNSKQNHGAVGLLTDNTIDRTSYYHHAVILALVSFKNPELY